MDAKITGLLIAKKRKEKKLTQTELAELLQVTDKAISRWETGEGFPEISMLPKLSVILGVKIDELLQVEQTKELHVNDRKYSSKFEMMSMFSISTMFLGLLIGVMLIYLTENKYWALLPFFVLGFVGYGIFFYQRYKYIIDSNYNDEDKQRINKQTKKFIFISLCLIYLLLPQYILPLIYNMLGSYYVVEEAYIVFSAYLWIGPLSSFILGSITVIIAILIHSIKQESKMSKPLPKVQLLLSSIGFMYALFAFVLSYARLFHDLSVYVIPFLVLFMILPYTIILIKQGMSQIKPFVLNILLASAIGIGIFLHHMTRMDHINNGFGGAYDNPIFVILGYLAIGLVAVGLSLKFLSETHKTLESDDLTRFASRSIFYLFVLFLNLFIFIGKRDVTWIAIFSLVVMTVWFVSEILIMTKKYSVKS